jgi:hypothetical protein
MAHFSKDEPGGAPGGHYWHEAGEIVEVVEDHIAEALRRIPGFHEVTEEEATAPVVPVEPPEPVVPKVPAPAVPAQTPTPTPAATPAPDASK